MMQRQFDAIIKDVFGNGPAGMDSAGDAKVLLAVSGGIDSMCMADLALHSSAVLDFAVAHCNFHLRGEESDSDTAFVREWCAGNGVAIHVADFDTAGFASANGLSIEMAARELRYRWFGQLCIEYGYAGVLVAHNANDNAETLLLNLLRGTGLRGLAGMGRVSAIPYAESADGQSGKPDGNRPLLCRPMLGFTRKQIEGHMMAGRLPFREDSTNADTVYRRNRIRNDVFPMLEKINPSFIKTFNREMEYFSQAAGLLDETVRSSSLPLKPQMLSVQADKSADSVPDGSAGEVRISLRSLLSFRHWPYLLYMYLEPYGFNSASIASVERLIRSAAGGGTTLSGKVFRSDTHILVSASDALIVKPVNPLDEVSPHLCRAAESDSLVEISGPGRYAVGSTVFAVEVKPLGSLESLKCPGGMLVCDSDLLPFPFVCRSWQPGDWFRPFGMRGRKKVSDLFTDLKFDAFRKSSTPVVVGGNCRGSHIAAVLGVRIDDSLKVTADTSEVLVLTIV